MLSLPREIIDIIAGSPSAAAVLSWTCHDLRAKTAKSYTMTRKLASWTEHIYTKNTTGEYITVSKNGPECMVYGEMPPLEDVNPVGKKIRCGNKYQRRINVDTIVLVENNSVYFGDAADLHYIEKVMFVSFTSVYKVTGVYHNFESNPIAAGYYVVISDNEIEFIQVHGPENLSGTILPLKRLY